MRIGRTSKTRNALTIIECLIALTILSVVFLAVTYTVVAAQAHVHESDTALRAVRLGNDLIEEMIGRPYSEPAQTPGQSEHRMTFALGDYHGFTEEPGAVRDFAGQLYPQPEQQYRRSATAETSSLWLPDLDRTLNGLTITVTVEDARGRQWPFVRFVPEPVK